VNWQCRLPAPVAERSALGVRHSAGVWRVGVRFPIVLVLVLVLVIVLDFPFGDEGNVSAVGRIGWSVQRS
jgi:hypothetical protein